MEIDELKNAWTALDDRLKKNETLNERIVQEMLQNKSKKSLNKLINFELSSLIICILAIPFFVWLLISGRLSQTLNTLMIFWTVYLILGIAWQVRKLVLLMKLDLSKAISNNIRFVQQYNIFIKKDKVMAIFGTLAGVISYLIIGISIGAGIWKWTLLISFLIVITVYSIWAYKKIYDANIQSITKSLEELKELED